MLAASKSAANPKTFAEQQVELLSHGGRNALPLRTPTAAAIAASVLITGETTPERLREADNAGISVIHKPVTSDAIKEVLYNVFHPRTATNGHALRVGQMRTDHL